MAELNLKQIIDRLNEEFMGDTRKLVFWYDDKAEFAEDIQGIELILPDEDCLIQGGGYELNYRFDKNVFYTLNQTIYFYK